MLVSFGSPSLLGLVSDFGALTGVRGVFMFDPMSLDVRVSGDEDPGTSVLRAFFLEFMVCRRRVSFKVAMAISKGNTQKRPMVSISSHLWLKSMCFPPVVLGLNSGTPIRTMNMNEGA